MYLSQGCVGKSGKAVNAGACRGLVLGCDNRQSPSAVSWLCEDLRNHEEGVKEHSLNVC